MRRLVGSSLAIAALFVGCSHGDQTAQMACEVVKTTLKAPSTFSLVSSQTLWTGQSEAGDAAYIVRVEYDAQNGFGATIRDCRMAAFSSGDGEHFKYKPQFATDGCLDGAPPEMVEPALNAMIQMNDFKPSTRK